MPEVSSAEAGHNPFVKYDTATAHLSSKEPSLRDELEAMHAFYEIFAHMSEESPTKDKVDSTDT